MNVKISQYFGRPRLPWFFIYSCGAMLMLPLLISVWALTLGSFRPAKLVGDWAKYCIAREDQYLGEKP